MTDQERLNQLEAALEKARAAYVELTNSVGFCDDGHSYHLANSRMMASFDELFDLACLAQNAT
jgi:hypothetical protein